MGILERLGMRLPPIEEEEAPGYSMTAAAQRVKIAEKGSGAVKAKKAREWQRLAWHYFDNVGEVKYAVNFLGNALSKLGLFVGVRPEPSKDPEPTDNAAAMDALERLRSPVEGHAAILQRLAVNLSIPGECYLVGYSDRSMEQVAEKRNALPAPVATPTQGVDDEDEIDTSTVERWEIRSIDEVVLSADNRLTLREAPASEGQTFGSGGIVLDEDEDFVLRLWTPHAQYASLADSPMRAVLAHCEELLVLERATRSAGKSRVAGAGALLVPDELSEGQADHTQDELGADTEDPLMVDMLEAMTTAIADEDSAAAVAPLIIRGRAAALKELRHLTFDRPFDAEIDRRTERTLRRLAQGLNVPPEVVLGLSTGNHWTSWLIDDDTFKSHLQPLAILAVNSLTTGYLTPALRAAKVPDPEKYVMWFDPTKLVVRPNRGQDAKDAHGSIVISDRALREATGFDDEDAPSEDEVLRRTAISRGPLDPAMTAILLRLLGGAPPELEPSEAEVVDSPAEEAEQPETGAEETGPPPEPEAAVAAAGSRRTLGQRLVDLDRQLRARVQAAADAAMRRALEKAGASLRSKTRRDKQTTAALRGVDNRRVAATLGPSLVAGLGVQETDLVRSAFDDLGPQFSEWVRQTQERALAMVEGLEDAAVDRARARQAEDRETAWAYLRDALAALALERLYDPDPRAPEKGEHDASLSVPVGIVREALARAGGSAGDEATLRAAGIRDRLRSAFGVAAGWLMQALFRSTGHTTEGYVWDYGDFPRTNPFEPHEALDGVFFENFDDPALVNDEGWPDEAYWTPGDHSGCSCDWVLDIRKAG